MEEFVQQVFSQYAYSPLLVYAAIVIFMLLSGFGMPIPEELILISSGFVGYMALNPELFPPPSALATPVNVYTLAAVAFFAVIGSDYLIYSLGKRFGPRLFKMKFFARLVSESALGRIQLWTRRYGYWAVFFFRFTPGLRFPGHLMCGAMGLSPWRFVGIDVVAAGISVPTQVLLVSLYGKQILEHLGRFKLYFFSALAIGLLMFVLYRRRSGVRT